MVVVFQLRVKKEFIKKAKLLIHGSVNVPALTCGYV